MATPKKPVKITSPGSIVMIDSLIPYAEIAQWKAKNEAMYAQAASSNYAAHHQLGALQNNAHQQCPLAGLGIQQAQDPWVTSTSTVRPPPIDETRIRDIVHDVLKERTPVQTTVESDHTHFMIGSLDHDYCLCGHKVYHAQAGLGHRSVR